MPSGSPPRPRLAWLRSQGLGLLCGFATVLLLAVGSVVLSATREGASAGVQMDDLRGFFAPPRLAHLWLYLLFPVFGLYALNTALATWDTVARKWRVGVRAPTAYAASIVHVGFLLALVAHLVGGFLGEEGEPVLLTSGWQEVPGFGEARLVSLDVETLPGGMPKEVDARVEVRGPGGEVTEHMVGYNAPLSAGGGARLALLSDMGRTHVARLASGGHACALAEGQSCRLEAGAVRLLGFAPGAGGGVAAIVRAPGPAGAEVVRVLPSGGELPLLAGAPLRLEAVTPEPAILVRTRRAPGNPWALAASILMAAGVALLWRKLAR